MLNINENYLKSHKCYAGQNKPKYIVVHETDNWAKGAGARAHALAHFNGNLGSASVHYFVDDKEIYKTLNHEDAPWAVGDNNGYSDITNYNSINLEICVNPDSDYDTAWYNAVDLVRHLIQITGMPAANVKMHRHASGKWCPRKMLDNDWWPNFMAYINNPSKATPTSPQTQNIDIPADFDYIAYLQKNSRDIIECILNNGFNSGVNGQMVENACKWHYQDHGKQEGRIYK